MKKRIRQIERTYDIEVTYDDLGTKQLEDQLTEIEKALEQIGPELACGMATHYRENTAEGPLTIRVTEDENWESVNVVGTFSVLNNTIELYLWDGKPVPSTNIVHEWGHVYHRALPRKIYQKFCDINGGNDSYRPLLKRTPDPRQYISSFAAQNAAEDFAETFAAMVLDRTPPTAEKGSLLYKKCRWIAKSLAETLGEDCEIASQAAAYVQQFS